MSLKDVTEQNMTSGQAGAAFVAGRVDVAVTWEPWLTRASKTAFGRVLVSSKQYPDLIMDAFAFRRDFVQKYPGTVKDFIKAYYDAYTWMTQNQDQANQLIGAAVKEPASDVQSDLGTMTIFSLAQSKVIMGTNDHPGKIFSNAKAAGDFWKQQGQVSSTVVRYMPASAFIPLLILLQGLGENEKITVIWIGVFFQLVLMVMDIAQRVPSEMLNVAYTLGANRATVFRKVFLPATWPEVVDVLRITMGWAWTYLIVAELVAANAGIGNFILIAERYFRADRIIAAIITIGILGLMTDFFFGVFHRWAFPYVEKNVRLSRNRMRRLPSLH